jgi:hypothetical protein
MKNVNWLPTMATHWEKQLSLQKVQIQIKTAKRISTQKQQRKNRTNIIINHLIQQCFKRCKPKTILRSASHDFMIKSSILLAWPLLPAGVHSLDRVAI